MGGLAVEIKVWTARKRGALYCMEFSLMYQCAWKEAGLTLRRVPSPLHGTSARMRSKRRGSSCRGSKLWLRAGRTKCIKKPQPYHSRRASLPQPPLPPPPRPTKARVPLTFPSAPVRLISGNCSPPWLVTMRQGLHTRLVWRGRGGGKVWNHLEQYGEAGGKQHQAEAI